MVSDEDDFFKYFINTYANKDLTNDKDLIEYFEKHICKNDFHEVEKFLNDVISLCNLIIDLYSLDETPNQFQKYTKKEKDRIKILVVLFEFSRRCTDNVRFLLFYFGRTQKNNQIDVELLEIFLLNLTKSVIYNFIFKFILI